MSFPKAAVFYTSSSLLPFATCSSCANYIPNMNPHNIMGACKLVQSFGQPDEGFINKNGHCSLWIPKGVAPNATSQTTNIPLKKDHTVLF